MGENSQNRPSPRITQVRILKALHRDLEKLKADMRRNMSELGSAAIWHFANKLDEKTRTDIMNKWVKQIERYEVRTDRILQMELRENE